jgi:TAT-translocated FGD2 family F420-dependent dehydrogenase
MSRRAVLGALGAATTSAMLGAGSVSASAPSSPPARAAAAPAVIGPAVRQRRANVKIGFVLSHEQFAAPQLVDFGVAAEQAGFDMVWTSDHFQPWQPNEGHAMFPWVTLSALGQRTSSITLGTGVTCPTYRHHPTEVAQAFASLGVFYPGRVFLGVGTGEALNEAAATGSFGKYQERADRLTEAIGLIRQLWTGDDVTHDGQYYHTRKARIYDLPPQPVPIYVAAAGPKSARLAGLHGDGWIAPGEPLMKPEMHAAFEEGARAAGKDPSVMPIITESFVVTSDDPAAVQAGAEMWRFLPKATKLGYVDNPDEADIQRRAEAENPLEEVSAKWPIGSDPQVHAQALQKLIEAGATHIVVHSPEPDQLGVIQFYGEKVLPLV